MSHVTNLSHPSAYFTSRNYLRLLCICVLLLWTVASQAQISAKAPDRTTINPQNYPINLQQLAIPIPVAPDGNPLILPGNPLLDDPSELLIAFDWTHCQMHQVNSTPALEVFLPGNYSATNPQIWKLSTIAPQSGSSPEQLHYVEGVCGQSAPPVVNVPLTWEIAFDGGSYVPMTLQPDNSLTATFPAGAHTFQVRITGVMQSFQDDGYYRLLLSQYFTPQL